MKKIIKAKKPSKTVSLDNLQLEEDNIIGFKHECGPVGILIRQEFHEDCYRVVSLNQGSFCGNAWDAGGGHDTLEDLIERLMPHGDFFLFENVEEFAAWLVDNC